MNFSFWLFEDGNVKDVLFFGSPGIAELRFDEDHINVELGEVVGDMGETSHFVLGVKGKVGVLFVMKVFLREPVERLEESKHVQ